jgi:chromosomal replication initiator protein
LLVIEDIGDVRDRPIAQQQLTYRIDEVSARGGLAVITSRVPPAESRALMPMLRSRLTAGLVVPLAMPGLSARRALIVDWAALLGVLLADEAVDVLAAGLEVSPSQLRGAVISLACGRGGGTIDAATARQFLATHGGKRDVSMRTVAAKTARYFGLTLADLKSSSRQRHLVEARAVAMYLARRLTKLSLDQIGAYFGQRDHTTVLHSCRRTQELQTTDTVTRQAVASLEETLKGTSGGLAQCRRRNGGKPVDGWALSGPRDRRKAGPHQAC